MAELTSKVAVVTGASSGIGRAIALAFAAAGARVVVNYCRSGDRAEAVKNDIITSGGEALTVQADMASSDAIRTLLETTREYFGRVDIWVNNAGADILTGAGAAASLEEKLHQLIEVDLKGTINACWAVAPVMKEQGDGVILNMSWDLAMHGFKGSNPQVFAATKAGIIGFSRSLALSFAPEVRVNVLAPGWIKTAYAEADMDDDYYRQRLAEIPLGRFGTPEDVASVALYLAAASGNYITGEVIKINGGLV